MEKKEPNLKDIVDILEDIFKNNFYLINKLCHILYENPFIMDELEIKSQREMTKYLNKLMKTEFQSFFLEFIQLKREIVH